MPDNLLTSPGGAASIRRALVRQNAVFDERYAAQSDLLTVLPNETDGSLRRNEDGTLSVILHYRADLKWSDGEPFKTADALLGLKFPPPDDVPAVVVLEATEGDALSVFLTLSPTSEYPYVPFQPPLPSHKLGTVDTVSVNISNYALKPDPTLGPYLVAARDDSAIVLSANPFFVPAPRISVLRILMASDASSLVTNVSSGLCDVALDTDIPPDQYPSLIAAQDGGQLRAIIWEGNIRDQLVFNTFAGLSGRVPLFADIRVRLAVASAWDRVALVGSLWHGSAQPLDSWLPAGHWAHSSSPLAQLVYDPERARALLEEAGWRDTDGDGVREYHGTGGEYSCQRGAWSIEEGVMLTPTLILPEGDEVRGQIADNLKTQLASIGIRLDVQKMGPESMFVADGPVTRREFDLALLTAAVRPDPGGVNEWLGADLYLHPLDKIPVHRWQLEDRWLTSDQLVERLSPGNIPSEDNDFQGQNYSGWCNEQADIDIIQANRAFDLATRQGFYKEQQALVGMELPALPIAYRPRLLTAAPYVCGIMPDAFAAPTWNIADWYFEPAGICGEK